MRDFLSEEEVLTFMRAVDHDVVRVAIAAMFYAGLRVSEVTKLMVEDVDLKQGFLYINDAKGGKSRIVPLSPKLRVILEDYLEWKGRFTLVLCYSQNRQAIEYAGQFSH